MPDVFTTAKRSEVMSRILSKGNAATELRLVALMREHGITGWRRHLALTVRRVLVRSAAALVVRVRPDFVFRRQRVAVFVDGCYWHGCPVHYRRPKGNRKFWDAKILRNQTRDRLVTRELRRAGWTVLRLWECGLAKKRVNRTMGRLRRALSL
ncbi:MAG: very short patch repair endonuclease [Prosthecobacter sp.]